MPWRGPSYEGEVPTLGWSLLDQVSDYLVVPDGPSAGEPFELTREQAQFFLNFYRVDPDAQGPARRGRSLVNSRLTSRAILCRPKGWGKSPLLGVVSICEALFEVVFDGWDAYGEPVARPWSSLGFKAKTQILAVSEEQTGNTWDPLLDMVRGSPDLVDDYHLDVKETFVSFPGGRMEYSTSAADTAEGGRPVFAVLDQTEAWTRGNGGVRLAAAVRRNLTKTQGSSIESPNAYVPGAGTVAEASFKAYAAQQRRAKANPGYRPTILLDHRPAPDDVDIYDEKDLKRGLAVAYGDSADVAGGWVNLDRVVEDFWDPDSTVEDSRRFFLNQIQQRADSWVTEPELRAVRAVEKTVAPGEMVTLGFDGSRGRKRGVTDATALVACRVSDGHVFEPFERSVWEQPHTWDRRKMWRPPVAEVEAAVAAAFRRWNVVGFYADPAMWESYVAGWEAKYGARLLVKSSRAHPIEWWMTGQRSLSTVKALELFRSAVEQRELTYDGGLFLTAHILNARVVQRSTGNQIAKQHPESPDKIDAAVAAVLAYQARVDAIAAGALRKPRKRVTVRRIR